MHHENIKKMTKENIEFHQIVETGEFSQLVLMSIPAGKETGSEVHEGIDQFIFVVDGDAEMTVENERFGADDGDMVFVASGKNHNIKNAGDKDLKLYTIYSPPARTEET